MSGYLLPQNLSCWSLKPIGMPLSENTLTANLGSQRKKMARKHLEGLGLVVPYRQELCSSYFFYFQNILERTMLEVEMGVNQPSAVYFLSPFNILA